MPQNFLLLAIEELPFLPGHRPGVPGTAGCPGRFQNIYVIFLMSGLLRVRLEERLVTGIQKGGFVKGWFWRMWPRSGFRSEGGFGECALVPVFVPGEHPPKPPFWKPPFCQHPHWENRRALVPT